jgi:arylsulfatase A-like enzyme
MNWISGVALVVGVMLVFTGAKLTAAQSGATQPSAAHRPNVVVFLMDDMGLHDLGCTGSTFYETPNIDALARRGCMFPVSYAACPVCSPTRAAIMTGKYPPRVKVTDYIGGPQPAKAARLPKYKDRLLPAPYQNHLALEETTIAEAMKDAGYATFFAGKWHLGGEPYYPEKQGFDVNIGGGHQGSPGKGGYFSPYTVPLSPGPKGEHLDLRLARETTKWISQQSADKPFFAYFALYDVHIPLMAPQETIEYFQAKRDRLHLDDQFTQDGKSKERLNQSLPVYAAMVKTSDDAIGMVIDQLKQQNLLDKTIIIFTSDNGGLSTAQGWPTSNEPQRAGKGWAYEGGVREPLIIDAPGVTRPGSSSDQRTISMDLYPTILDLCGLPPRPKQHMDGISLVPALRGQKLPDRALFWHYPHYGDQGGSPYSAILDGDWKLIVFHDPRQGVELYNLPSDPGEKHNLADDHQEKVKAMREKLDQWKKEVGAIDAKPRT